MAAVASRNTAEKDVGKEEVEDGGVKPVLTIDSINENVRQAEYAVRGKLYNAAKARSKEGKKVILTNVGNPQALGQKPITFFRQVLALVNYPDMIDDPRCAEIFAPDVLERAKTYLKNTPGGTGAYQDSRGNEYVRQEVVQFLEDRDGYSAEVDDIFLTDGASQGISLCMFVAIRGRQDGILTPIPQYPLYAASIELRNGSKCGYYLDEDHGWGLSIEELERTVRDARAQGVQPRAIVIINPGNPTGQCLSEENMKEIVRFCKRERLVILADEVYQTNVYSDGAKFVSFRKVVLDMGKEAEGLELFSFHTVSKGVVGECGRRGAYFQCTNIDPDVMAEIYKVMSTNLSSNTDGQIMTGLMINPPKPGDASYEQYHKETSDIFESLKRRAKKISDIFNKLDGISCNPVEGALYCYPQIKIPEKAIEEAKSKGLAPDVMYCMELLDETGICCIPGSGFGQPDGTFHLRTTILPSEDQFDEITSSFGQFHKSFMEKHSA
mmetsp:Transcript_5961/g.17942  ORF Transcript_5961/g.17942 Transcript_5961/m.17942 type:complete len:496 (+) Transcript_5961:133-1620(+)|eukprot:CAMPEP_0198734142 /NCGR_PEP_ID=MMETSP1475-20131203/50689_1 /TAXON_ID= ORGANISM="Unidentified sp., Strain CCMP1999" /NCGR_SAMPLE_ID=MMETSP1475 /ASSEMBLY_ACC=CAM_ASM_001111 /LENGTH=495 /DNA_ID=CAMNT_0044497555 /DNA_START=128 /DNA_END=1615 /DNA_ORIENTATION=-